MTILTALSVALMVTAAPPPVIRAADVADSVGVNVHVEYTDGGYRDLAQVVNALRFIGVDKVRDAAPNPHNQGQAGYLALARAGVRFNLFVNGEEIAPALKRIAELVRAAPGSVLAVEGPNEVNNLGGIKHRGITDPHLAAVTYQNELFEQVRATRALDGIPVATFTDYPVYAGRSDLGNFHSYPKRGRAPGPQLRSDADAAEKSTPNRPLIATEFGFPTYAGEDGVSDLAQSRLLLTSLLDLTVLGSRSNYIYQLLDAYADVEGKDAGRHYGVFDVAYRPKASARMLRRLMALLDDRSPVARTFAPPPPRVVWQDEGDDVRRLIMQKGNGETLVAVWREVAVYDPVKAADLDPPARLVEVGLPTSRGQVRVIDLVANTGADVAASVSKVTLSLGVNPLMIQIKPPG